MPTTATQQDASLTGWQEFGRGAQHTLPMILGAIPFGILFGALATTVGLSPVATIALSSVVFAGSAQFIAATLVGQGASVLVIVATTFVVNLRHALYAASLGPYLRNLSWRWLVPLGFWLTDETYAIVIKRFESADLSPLRHWYFLGSAVAMYLNWQVCTGLGIVAGQKLAGLADLGLEFALVVTFIGIVIPLIVSLPMLMCAVTAALLSVLLYDLPHQIGLMLASGAAIAVGVVTEVVHKRICT